MTLTLVGEHNPHGADPRAALFPRPANSAGDRLRQAQHAPEPVAA